MPFNLPPSMKRTLLHAGGGAAAGAALGGLTSDPEHRMRGAVQGGVIGGAAAGGASFLANRSAAGRINGLKGEVAQGAQQVQGLRGAHDALQAQHGQAQAALRGASTEASELRGQLQQANTRIGRLTGQPTNSVSQVPITPAPPSLSSSQINQANTVVDQSLQRAAVNSAPPASHVTPVPAARAAMTPPPPADPTSVNATPFQPWASGPMRQVTAEEKTALGPLGGALAGAVSGAAIGSGASALSGERDPKKLARNALGGAALGGCTGFGVAHAAGRCAHKQGFDAGYARRQAFEPQVEDLMREAGTRLLSPLDALRAQT